MNLRNATAGRTWQKISAEGTWGDKKWLFKAAEAVWKTRGVVESQSERR
jgi:hypothetical protein